MTKAKKKKNEINIGGNVTGSVVVAGDNNIIHYYAAVEANIEKHEPDYWALQHPYPMPPNFTGRVAERAALVQWLNDDSEKRLLILRALGGFGKSSLSWHWLTHDVDPEQWPKVFWWSFYEGDASFENFIKSTLDYLKVDIPQGQRPQVDELLKAMQRQKILLILDGFERALRAYNSMDAAYQGDEEPELEGNQLDCVNINAEWFLRGLCAHPNIKSKVLMTTRLTPRAVKPRGELILGCYEVELTAMQKEDAVEFFQRQKIKGTRSEIEAACEPYGYHPLSLRLLAGRILKDFEKAGDIRVARKLKMDGDLIQQRRHILEVAYNSLALRGQKLLSTVACFRSPVELKTLQSILEEKEALEDDLHDLVERGLLHFDDNNKRFDLHPIVRRYAYERLTTTERIGTHSRLRDHFAALPTLRHSSGYRALFRAKTGLVKTATLESLTPVIELYHHTVNSGELERAYELFSSRLASPLYYEIGAYATCIELLRALFTDDEHTPPRLWGDRTEDVINRLANSYALSGQPQRAISLYEMENRTYRRRMERERKAWIEKRRDPDLPTSAKPDPHAGSDRLALARNLGNIAYQQLLVGALREADSTLRTQSELAYITLRMKASEPEGTARQLLGWSSMICGQWRTAQEELTSAMTMFDDQRGISTRFLLPAVASFRALHLLAINPSLSKSSVENRETIMSFLQRVVKLAGKRQGRVAPPDPRYLIHANWLLGSVHRTNGQFELAENTLTETLAKVRQINLVEIEADVLLELAHLRCDQKRHIEAQALAEEALTITERCGYVLQGADVNLFLAQYALGQKKDEAKAKEYAETALKLAYCDGPPYYYKVAYEEAERMLERLK